MLIFPMFYTRLGSTCMSSLSQYLPNEWEALRVCLIFINSITIILVTIIALNWFASLFLSVDVKFEFRCNSNDSFPTIVKIFKTNKSSILYTTKYHKAISITNEQYWYIYKNMKNNKAVEMLSLFQLRLAPRKTDFLLIKFWEFGNIKFEWILWGTFTDLNREI